MAIENISDNSWITPDYQWVTRITSELLGILVDYPKY